MKKYLHSLITVLFLVAVLFCTYYLMMPRGESDKASLGGFSTEKALGHVGKIASKPHYTGSPGHKEVSQYILQELKSLGLEPQVQKGFSISDKGVLAYSENILARIEGTQSSKALLLLSHYDSAPHSKSKGAADNAVGVATILEGVRAYLQTMNAHRNDIIILFSDTEEVGLNGAALFVQKHPWAKDVGLALNFEARGTGGPSYMLMEVNKGNAAMIKGFSTAGLSYPATNSLMYSIYKMLPNDTDLTVFREGGNIQGFNFAFIDDHFNYHTIQDDVNHLDVHSLTHQGTYLMPLLKHFGDADLSSLEADDDYVYFSTPFSMVTYPFAWVIPMAVISLVIFLVLLTIGFAKKILSGKLIARGFLLYLGCFILLPALAYLGWQLILILYPSYSAIPHGFTYNGHLYIAAFLIISLSVAFFAYRRRSSVHDAMNFYVAPLTIVFLFNGIIAFLLPGAGFLIIPLLCGLVSFASFIVTQKHFFWLNLILSVPACIVFYPLINALPIGLGLKNVFIAVLLLILVFGLLLPVLMRLRKRHLWACYFALAAVGFLAAAHFQSEFEAGRAKPNSLVYVLDKSTGKASWASYDRQPDMWTSVVLGKNPTNINPLSDMSIGGKYGAGLRLSAPAQALDIPGPAIHFAKDTIINNRQFYTLSITPNRFVNRYDLYLRSAIMPENLTANGEKIRVLRPPMNSYYKLLQYYVVDNKPLEMRFSSPLGVVPELTLLESSFDLTEHPGFDIKTRPSSRMPLPFVLNDAIILRQNIKLSKHQTTTNTMSDL